APGESIPSPGESAPVRGACDPGCTRGAAACSPDVILQAAGPTAAPGYRRRLLDGPGSAHRGPPSRADRAEGGDWGNRPRAPSLVEGTTGIGHIRPMPTMHGSTAMLIGGTGRVNTWEARLSKFP